MNSESVTDHGSLSSSSNPISPAHYLLKLQVYNTSPHFGKGVISLMLLIQQGHSIRSASQVMNMAYSKAWKSVKNTEERLGFTLIERRAQHGSVLTDKGEEFLLLFIAAEERAQKAAQKILDNFDI